MGACTGILDIRDDLGGGGGAGPRLDGGACGLPPVGVDAMAGGPDITLFWVCALAFL